MLQDDQKIYKPRENKIYISTNVWYLFKESKIYE